MNYGETQAYQDGLEGWTWRLGQADLGAGAKSWPLRVTMDHTGKVVVHGLEENTVKKDGEDSTFDHHAVSIAPAEWVGVVEALARSLGMARDDAWISKGWLTWTQAREMPWGHDVRANLRAEAERLLSATSLSRPDVMTTLERAHMGKETVSLALWTFSRQPSGK